MSILFARCYSWAISERVSSRSPSALHRTLDPLVYTGLCVARPRTLSHAPGSGWMPIRNWSHLLFRITTRNGAWWSVLSNNYGQQGGPVINKLITFGFVANDIRTRHGIASLAKKISGVRTGMLILPYILAEPWANGGEQVYRTAGGPSTRAGSVYKGLACLVNGRRRHARPGS